MYIHVYTLECTYHVRTMYIRVYTTFAEMYIHVCTCLCFSIIISVYHVRVCQLLPRCYSIVHTRYIHGTDIVHVYARWPGQDSRCRQPPVQQSSVRFGTRARRRSGPAFSNLTSERYLMSGFPGPDQLTPSPCRCQSRWSGGRPVAA